MSTGIEQVAHVCATFRDEEVQENWKPDEYTKQNKKKSLFT
jgi:hypothetical protein